MRLSDRWINLVTGALSLVVVAVVIASVAGILWPENDVPDSARSFVAYFDDAGGIEPGDAVRIKGRRAGVVTGVELVIRDGRPMNRVEFLISPGTGSSWLATSGIPVDSRIEVNVPRMFRRPQLVITPGEEAEQITEGGEWRNAKGRDSDDDIVRIKASLDQFGDAVTSFGEFLDDPEGMQEVEASLARLHENMVEIDERATSLMAGVGNTSGQLDNVREQLDALAADFVEARGTLGAELDKTAKGSEEAITAADSTAEQLARLVASVERFEAQTVDAQSGMERAGLATMGIELRRMAARLRASMEVAKDDPSQAGDMPNWRRSRKYFNGKHPLPGGDPE
jgi:ABC-type transporter Mla subunit MlaD